MLPPETVSGTAGAPTEKQVPEVGGGAEKPQAQPAGEDWQAKYNALKSERDELDGRYQAYAKHGKPEDIERGLQWARVGMDYHKRISDGEYVPKSAIKQPADAAPDPYEKWDELTPREQAEVMRAQMRDELKRELLEPLKQEFTGFQQRLTSEQQIGLKLARLAAAHPDLNAEELMAEAIAEANKGGLSLLDAALERKLQPKLQQKAIDDAVAAALEKHKATQQQEEENARIASFQRHSSPRLMRRDPKDKGSRMREAEMNYNRRWDDLSRRAG